MITDARLRQVAEAVTDVPGIVGVVLGGSRARGEEHPDSDVDLGLYYRAPLDLPRLRALAADLADPRGGGTDGGNPPELTEPGGWGPLVDGGGWLRIDDTPVDWIYRDVERVVTSAHEALAGRVQLGFQVGHPFGVSSFAYAGELALGVILTDPSGELSRLRARLDPYPEALARAVEESLWEADFLLGAVGKSAGRGDTTMVAGVLFRVVIWCAHVVCARAGRWVITEKGLVDAAGRMSGAPTRFAEQAHEILARPGRTPADLGEALHAARDLVALVRAG